ncbi:hypothetical protein ACOZ4L_14080 [Haloplanus ruber]|uniref:Uncharacterized protein n=1 Tax=Haloplanus ruber TaxID=869892 RepID=A0ABD6CXL9_9EURY|nr:hypothetical protein [Haloplanus ruber]
MFASAFVMVGIYLYFDVLRDGYLLSSLIMAVGFALSGFAESLPTDRRRAAGGLRVVAILWLIGLLGLTVFAPDIVLGPGSGGH